MTGLDLAGEEELSSSFEPCLTKLIQCQLDWLMNILIGSLGKFLDENQGR